MLQKATTREKIIELLKTNPNMTRAGLTLQRCKSVNTIKEHLANLKTEGRLKRIGIENPLYALHIGRFKTASTIIDDRMDRKGDYFLEV